MSDGILLRAAESGVVLGSPEYPVADGQVMQFDAASGLWFPRDLPASGILRKVASGTTVVPAFGSAEEGPFQLAEDEAPTVLVYGPTDVGQPSSWGVPPQGEFCWQFVSVGGGDKVSIGFQNAGGSDREARWVLVAATL